MMGYVYELEAKQPSATPPSSSPVEEPISSRYAVQMLEVDRIVVGRDRRPVDSAAVAVLAQSIKTNGLQTPISVRLLKVSKTDAPLFSSDIDGARVDHSEAESRVDHLLVTGGHRLAAVKLLGHSLIPAIILNCDEVGGEMLEIAENLHRVELTRAQRDRSIRRYADLLQAQEGRKVGQSAPLSPVPVTGRGNKGLARKIAEQTGLKKRTVQRSLNRTDPNNSSGGPGREAGEHDEAPTISPTTSEPQSSSDRIALCTSGLVGLVGSAIKGIDSSHYANLFAGLRAALEQLERDHLPTAPYPACETLGAS